MTNNEPSPQEWKEWLIFHENLLSQRTNFLLVFVGIIAASIANTGNVAAQVSALSIGSVLSILVTITIWRAQNKINYLIKELHARYPNDVAKLSRNA